MTNEEPVRTRLAAPNDHGPAGAQQPQDAQHHQLVQAMEAMLHHHLTQHRTEVEHRMAGPLRAAVRSGPRRLDHAVDVCTPAWLRPTEGEPRWPVAIAVMVAIGLQLSVPSRLAIQPQWLLPVLEAAILALLIVANPRRISTKHPWVRPLSLVLVGLATLANVYSAARLILNLVHGREGERAGPLLIIGGAVWLTNVIVFALWYWEFDRGGPAARAMTSATVASDTQDWVSMSSLAQRVIGSVSVGLNAVALVNDKYR